MNYPNLTVTLKRLHTGKYGTFGTLQVTDRDIICSTLEPPWKNNKKNESCIPAGEYTVKRYFSNKYGKVWQVQDVEGRTYILIHRGNIVMHTKGCILVGITEGTLRGIPAVVNSKGAWIRINKLFGDQDFKLMITDDMRR